MGSDITDSVLKTADGSDFKGVDDYQIKDLLDAVIQGADRPITTDILELALALMTFQFNLEKKVGANVEPWKWKAGALRAYGIHIDETVLALVIPANIELAAQEHYGREFCPTLQSIRRQFNYNHVPDVASISTIV